MGTQVSEATPSFVRIDRLSILGVLEVWTNQLVTAMDALISENLGASANPMNHDAAANWELHIDFANIYEVANPAEWLGVVRTIVLQTIQEVDRSLTDTDLANVTVVAWIQSEGSARVDHKLILGGSGEVTVEDIVI